MKINLSPINQVQKINYKKQEPKLISFGSCDEFIRTAGETTFKEAKRAIQEKYQPAISQLRSKQKSIAENVRERVMQELFSGRYLEGEYVQFYEKLKMFKDPNVDFVEPLKSLEHYIRRIRTEYIQRYTPIPNADVGNCIMISGKDKKLTEDIMSFSKSFTKVLSVFPNPDYTDKRLLIERGASHRVCFEELKDSYKSIGDFQEGLYNALVKAEERYKKTGNATILNVENMERLIDKTINPQEDIAVMKDFMSSANKDFHTLITFTNTDPSKSDPGTLVSHRVRVKFDIDKLGIKRDDLEFFHISDKLKTAVDNASQIYKEGSEEYISLTNQIDDLQAQCEKEIKQAKKSLPKGSNVKQSKSQPENKLQELIQNTTKKLSKNQKIGVIIGGTTALLATVGFVMYKKGMFKKLQKKPVTTYNPMQTQNLMLSNSNIFKEFAF